MSSNIASLLTTGGSPINLDDEVVKVKQFPPLIINGHWLNDGEAVLLNDGETAMVHLTGNRIPSTVTGGPLMSDVYEFHNAHFHWGTDNSNGSEHQINGTWHATKNLIFSSMRHSTVHPTPKFSELDNDFENKFSMEAHFVHWNRKYQTFDECLKHRDGLCVLTFLFLVADKYSEDNNPLFDKITENLKHVMKPETEIKIPANALCWMRDATRCPSYYSYSGTYNKGSFPECATWIVFPLVIPISACQVQEFRKLLNKEGSPIMQNRRGIQLLNGRKIYSAATTS